MSPSRTGGSSDRSAAVRQRLIDAATELIPELGWEAVSTRALAERAGVAPGLVHYHFTSIPELLRQASLGLISTMVGQLAQIDDPVEAVAATLDVVDGTEPASVLMLETALASLRDDHLRAGLTEVVRDFRRLVADHLRGAGVADPDATASVLAATIDGLMLHRALNPELNGAAVRTVLPRLIQGPVG